MHKFVSFNRRIIRAADAAISAGAAGALYGKSVFTTVAIARAEPLLWEKHWRRLKNNAEKINVDLSAFDAAATTDALAETIAANGVERGRARLTFFDESLGGIWNAARGRQTSLLIMTADRRDVPRNFRLTVSPYPINSAAPLVSVKSGNYLEKIIAADEARARGFDEAVRLNERGEVASACLANVFWTKGDQLFTPSQAVGCLPGTTREFILENRACREVETDLTSLREADAIYLTSAGVGAVQIAEFDGKTFERRENPIAQIIEREFGA